MIRNPDQLWQTLDRRIRLSLEERDDMTTKWLDYYRAYRGVRVPKNFPWPNCANVHVPITAIVVDTIVASLCNSLFSLDPLWLTEPYPDQGEPVAEASRKMQNFLRYACTEEIEDFQLTLIEWAQSAVLKGTGILKCIWRTERRRAGYWLDTFETDPVLGLVPSKVEGVEDRIVYDAPALATVDLENFIVPYGAKSISHAPFVAERIWLPEVTLRQRERDGWYENVDQLTQDVYDPHDTEAEINTETGQTVSEEMQEGYYVYDYWGFADVDGDGIEEEAHLVIAERDSVILRAEPNPYFHGQKPYLRVPFIHEPNRFYGTGICEQIFPLQQELNTLHNQRLDNASLCINKVFTWIPDGTLMDDQDVQIYPGARIRVNDHDSLKMLQMGDVNYSSVQEESMLIDYIQRLTGVTDMNMGQIPTAGRRAAATSLLAIMGEGNKKQELRIKTFRRPLEQLADMLKMMYYQFLPESRRYRVPGSDVFDLISSDDFRYDVNFRIAATTMAESPEMVQQKMQTWYALLSNNELIMSSPEAMYRLTREVLRHSPMANIDQILPESVLQEMVQAKQMAMMQQQAAHAPQAPGGNPGQDVARRMIGEATGGAGAAMGGASPGQHTASRSRSPQPPSGMEGVM